MDRRLLLTLPLFAAAGPALAQPRAEAWPRWERQDAGSARVVDGAFWAGFLRRHVRAYQDGINRVSYAAVTAEERAGMEADLARLAAVPVSTLSRAEQRAYWTNLYNELTVMTVLRAYPVASIRDIGTSPGLFTRGPWGAKAITVEGEALSLDDIEHRILRPIWRDPRTHYAVNCASIGCPNLPMEPFIAARMEAQLDAAAAAYVNHPRGFSVGGGALTVSSIYEWYKSDFGGNDAGVIEHLRRHARPERRASLEGISRISRNVYDWALNDAGR